jgi:hypothetical protein
MSVPCRDIVESALGEEVSAAGELGISGDCEYCHRPRAQHVIVQKDQLEAIWQTGIVVTVCASLSPDERAIWVEKNIETEDPCDEDFMRDISS